MRKLRSVCYSTYMNSIEEGGMQLEQALKEVPSIKASAVFYDRAVGAPSCKLCGQRKFSAAGATAISQFHQYRVGEAVFTHLINAQPVCARKLRSMLNQLIQKQ